jgi:UDP-N-acetyl-D-mannosaminuronate dehydrogenase
MGVGFVGAAMAAVVADTEDENGEPTKFVIGMQRPSTRSYWKIPLLNRGLSPVKSEDEELEPMIARCVNEKKTLTATFTYEVLKLADVVVSDVQCDYLKESFGNVRDGQTDMVALENSESFGNVRDGQTDMVALENSLEIVAEHIPPDTLVLIETTVAPGTTEQVAYPIMRKVFRRRGIQSDPLLAHSFERVMPGKEYVASIRDFWRVCSGINEEATRLVWKSF